MMVNQETLPEGGDDSAVKTDPQVAHPKVVPVPAMIYPYSAGVKGGILGGLAMIPIAVVYGLVGGMGIWYPVNLVAAVVIRSWQNASAVQMAQFHPEGLVLGLLIHLAMSVLLGFLFAVMMPALPKTPIFWAFVVGPVLWGGAIFAGLPLLNPVMAEYIDLPSFAIANIVYSLVLGLWIARTPKVSVKDGQNWA
jgi:hypothetical protein